MDIVQLIDRYAAYDHWANARVLDRVMHAETGVLDASVKSSFPSLRATFMHIRNAEATWRSRLIGETPRWPAETSEEMSTFLPHVQAMRELVRTMDLPNLLGTASFHDLKGNPWTQPRWEMLMHCFNHSSYHRGQLVTMMRTLGLSEIPAMDMVVFQRLSPADQAKW